VTPRARRLLLPLGMAVAFVILFDSIVVYPFRLFVVFLHEIGHAVAAILTGGRVVSIGLSANEGGVCVTRGGIPFVVLNAGYLGSLLFGALFLLLGTRRRNAAPVVGAIGAFTLLAALVYVRTWFGFAYTLTAGLLLILVALKLRPEASEWLLAAIGSMSMLYALADVVSDVILRHSGASDAAALARLTHVPALVWGVAWVGLSLVVLVGVVRRLA
jgi:hypothetical protein